MVPAGFDEENLVLDPPPGMVDCEALSVYSGVDSLKRPVVVSCWKMTDEEVEEFIRTRRIYLVCYGHSMPPVSLTGKNPFVRCDPMEHEIVDE